jgi:uncharacterized protein
MTHRKPGAVYGVVACAAALSFVSVYAASAYETEVMAWRRARVEKLTAPDDWLTLVGLHFLKDGPNTVGSAKDNDVVLAKGPARVGTVTVGLGGKVSLEVAAGAEVRANGNPVRRTELGWESKAKRTLVTFDTMTFFVIDRLGKKALRVRDSESDRRKNFVGLDYFPIDPKWRIVARWEAFDKSRIVPVTDMLGKTGPELIPGKAAFEYDGKKFELLPIDEGRHVPLFFVISDLTSGKETYPACRFLYVPWPAEGEKTIVLDFNHAENPPCAFTPFSMCPLPPKENRLPFAIPAGEKNYRGAHD